MVLKKTYEFVFFRIFVVLYDKILDGSGSKLLRR